MHQAELSILLHRALEARVATLMDRLALPGWEDQAEPLHQVRVASRRVRAVLDLVDPELYPGFPRQTRRFRRLTRALGLPRELDVYLALLNDLAGRPLPVAARAALEHALEVLARHRQQARAGMFRQLERVPQKKLPRILILPNLPNPFAGATPAEGIWQLLEPWLEAALRALPAVLEVEDPLALHALRIRVKRLRYALEILGAGFRTAPDPALRRLKAIQSALGDHHDLATLEAFLRGLLRELGERQRSVLAAGSLDLLSLLGEDRLCAFEAFRALALDLDADRFMAGLRLDLGLEATAEGNPNP
jgi:CHAD domain-containing protein